MTKSQQKTEVATQEKKVNSLSDAIARRGISDATWRAVCNSVFPGAKAESVLLAIDYCKARGLDVMKKPCHIVPMYVEDKKSGQSEWRDVIMPGISEIRMTAFRTGDYAGQDISFGESMVHTIGGEEIEAPDSCTVTVYRLINGEKCAFPHTEWFVEACGTKKNGTPNSMWRKRPRGQLAKCAEAGALRKAFPEAIGNEYAAEEMDGKTIILNEDQGLDVSETLGASGLAKKLSGQTQQAETESPNSTDDFVREMEEAEAAQKAEAE